MKKQIVVIHGGNAFDTYEEFLHYLEGKEVTLEKLKAKGWKQYLSDVLGNDYDVLTPQMPNSQNAKYLEWKIWFEKFIPFLNDGVVLVGHSMGGVFLAKYLSENKFPKIVKATLLVAAPYNADGERPLIEFVPPESLKGLEEQGGKIILYHSKDDPVVAMSELEKFRERLPTATFKIFEDRGHFTQEEFPEIVEDIRMI